MEIVKAAIDNLTGEQIFEFSITEKAPKIRWWQFWKKQQEDTVHTFKIFPTLLGTQRRIASLGFDLINKEFTDESEIIKVIPDNTPILINVLGLFITNSKEWPSEKLLDLLEWHLTNERMKEIIAACIVSMRLEGFMSSTVLIAGMPQALIPKTGPNDGSELIASHKQPLVPSFDTIKGLTP